MRPDIKDYINIISHYLLSFKVVSLFAFLFTLKCSFASLFPLYICEQEELHACLQLLINLLASNIFKWREKYQVADTLVICQVRK